jgi:hypothetical protein
LSSLADRIRGIVAPPGVSGVAQGFSPADDAGLKACGTGDIDGGLEPILGGAWRHTDGRRCFVVDRRWDPSALHGRERVGALAERLEQAAGEAPLFTGGAHARPPFVFFDLETTGLSGGAGTLAFLVGCAWFERDGSFVTRQFLLARHADERMLLEAVAAEFARAGALVSFNGKSFDAPLLEGRYLFHRLSWAGGGVPHVDVLHPARRFWKSAAARPFQGHDRGVGVSAPEARRRASPELDGSSSERRRESPARHGEGCSLQALERQILGARRVGDVPGFEIPGRYFQFVRSGDARPLEAVLEHNRLDLLTLAALTARLLHMTRTGPDAISDPREAFALGHVYARAGLGTRACDAFRHAADMTERSTATAAMTVLKSDALRALALTQRRSRQYADAAQCWRRLLELPGCPPEIAREAAGALAIHHEHRVRDLALARRFALGSLAAVTNGLRPSLAQAVRHRLARIERKMGASAQSDLLLD